MRHSAKHIYLIRPWATGVNPPPPPPREFSGPIFLETWVPELPESGCLRSGQWWVWPVGPVKVCYLSLGL